MNTGLSSSIEVNDGPLFSKPCCSDKLSLGPTAGLRRETQVGRNSGVLEEVGLGASCGSTVPGRSTGTSTGKVTVSRFAPSGGGALLCETSRFD